ncbi:YsnF/AvaK domain-containing protein [Streptomyces sp. INA 01156]
MSVRTGMFGSNESFIPIRDAELVEDHLEVPYLKEKVKGAPDVDVDSQGHLSESEEHRLYEYYGIDWSGVLRDDTGRSGEGRGDRHAGIGKAGRPARRVPLRGGRGRDGGHDRKGRDAGKTTPDRTTPGRTGTPGAAGTARTANTTAAGAAGTSAATGKAGRTTARGGPGADSMTRMEEEMHVRVERRETGRARLRKYVVTEEVEKIVPVRHEEVHVVREPITEADRAAALSGAEIGEADYEVTLHEERPVVETRAVPVERVRLTMEERTENETVRGRVRKERIESEGVPDDTLRSDDATRRGRDVPRRGRG